MQGDAKKFYQIFRGSLPIKRTPLLWSTGGPTSFDTLSRVNRQLYCYCNFMFFTGVFTNLFHLEQSESVSDIFDFCTVTAAGGRLLCAFSSNFFQYYLWFNDFKLQTQMFSDIFMQWKLNYSHFFKSICLAKFNIRFTDKNVLEEYY